MIIKSHIRGGYRAAADYLKDVGKNEKTRLVQISDLDARNLDEAFHNMWTTACNSKVKKPLHHISINPFKDERLTDEQVLKIVERAEQKYGYKSSDHQRVIVEHVLNGRQHFHVMWCRVSLTMGKAVWPGEHWKKSKQICREMETELDLKRPVPRRVKKRQLAVGGFRGGKKTLTRSPALGRPITVAQKTGGPTESKSAPVPAYKETPYIKSAGEQKFTPHREDIGGEETPSGRAEAAYQEEFGKWQGLIDAAASDLGVPKEQRLANVAALRLRQKAAAKAARKRARDEEQSAAKARRRARRILRGLPEPPSQG